MRLHTCPPVSDMHLSVTREGGAGLRLYAPRIDATPYLRGDFDLAVVVGDRCSLASISPTQLRRKRNGVLVFP
jgi:hypothetical protein